MFPTVPVSRGNQKRRKETKKRCFGGGTSPRRLRPVRTGTSGRFRLRRVRPGPKRWMTGRPSFRLRQVRPRPATGSCQPWSGLVLGWGQSGRGLRPILARARMPNLDSCSSKKISCSSKPPKPPRAKTAQNFLWQGSFPLNLPREGRLTKLSSRTNYRTG